MDPDAKKPMENDTSLDIFERAVREAVQGALGVFTIFLMSWNEVRDQNITPSELFLNLWQAKEWREVAHIMAQCRDRQMFTAMAKVLLEEVNEYSLSVLHTLPKDLWPFLIWMRAAILTKLYRSVAYAEGFSDAERTWILKASGGEDATVFMAPR